MTLAAERRAGRPRSAEADDAILAATLSLLAELGFDGMSVEAVAERAGVGKATIYRRWDSKQELVAAALASINAQLATPDTGSAREDMVELMRSVHRVSTSAPLGPSLSRLLLASAHNPALMEAVRASLIARRREMGRVILERGMARGEIRADIDPDVVLDMIVGAILHRVMVECTEIFALLPLLEQMLDIIWRGIATPEA